MKTTFRYLMRDKVFSGINVAGLAIGLTAVLYIAFYLWQETHYDNFHQYAENIGRVSMAHYQKGLLEDDDPVANAAMGPAFKNDIPEIADFTRVSVPKTFAVAVEDRLFTLESVRYADSTFWKIFDFPLLKGDAATALSVPYSVVLTEETAKNFFGGEDPMGKTVLADGADHYVVTGVAAEPPVDSHFSFKALASFSTLYRMPNLYMGWGGGNQYYTYIRAVPGLRATDLEEKINKVVWDNYGNRLAEFGYEAKATVQPLRDIHLHYDKGSNMLRTNLLIFALTAGIILVVAGINFINMTAARSLRRVKEAGVRKVLGAARRNLVAQFAGESLSVAFVAFVLAGLLFKLLEPWYDRLSGTALSPTPGSAVLIIGAAFVLTGVIGTIAAVYPAFRLSSLPIADAAKGGGKQKVKKSNIQNALVVLQFAACSALIICTLVVSRQLSYINNKDIGLNREQVLTIPLTGKTVIGRASLLKQRLEDLPGVAAATVSSAVPSGGFSSNGYLPEGLSMENIMMIHALDADADFLNVYGIKLESGRFFSDDREADKTGYVINETLAKTLGWNNDAVGRKITRNDTDHEVIGVVHDFHYASMYDKVGPLLITNESGFFRKVSVKLVSDNIPTLMNGVEAIWKEVNPDAPFVFNFFDDLYDAQYKSEQRVRVLFFAFSFAAIALAVLGMLSLMAYMIEQRRKEIGIRKVLGASTPDVLNLLLRQTAIQVLVANAIAWPLAWWFTRQWLDNFAYHIRLGWGLFALALFISAAIALMAVGWQAMRAATADPVKSIKTE